MAGALEEQVRALTARVAALEHDAGVQPSFSPLGGMRVAPDGAIAYDFDGHIIARGVDLQAESFLLPRPDPQRRVRWIDGDGLPVAEIYGYDESPGENPEHRHLRLDALTTGGDLVRLDAIASNFDNERRVDVRTDLTGAGTRTLLAGNGRSSFVQCGDDAGTPAAKTIVAAWSQFTGTIDFYVDGDFIGSVGP